MELRQFQNEALKRVLERYEAKKSSALLVMPAGTGKTVLSVQLSKVLVENYDVKNIGFVATTKVMESAFESMIHNRGLDANIKAFTPSELVKLIKDDEIQKEKFDVIIFDDFGDREHYFYEIIYRSFNCFKVAFTRNEHSVSNDIFLSENEGYAYIYSIEQSIVDGHYIESHKALSRHLYKNLEYEIQKIQPGTKWSDHILKTIQDNLKEIKQEYTEVQKVQEKLLSGKINNSEILELAHKKEQLGIFNKLLNDDSFFEEEKKRLKGTEAVWQEFFETNPWIFGFGLNYIFNNSLEGKKLEQVLEGFSVTGSGKRIDALLRTTGLISTLAFGEIKTHQKGLLKKCKTPYRPDSWSVSDELVGGIAQIHKTIQKSLKNISTALAVKDELGYTKYENIYLYRPKSFLIIGTLEEFRNGEGLIHEEKFSSFELFRRSVKDIEIITFDELFERANAIVNKKWK